MLTALSVARECSMVEENDKVILVQAYPPREKVDAQIEFINAEDKSDNIDDVVKKEKGVRI